MTYWVGAHRGRVRHVAVWSTHGVWVPFCGSLSAHMDYVSGELPWWSDDTDVIGSYRNKYARWARMLSRRGVCQDCAARARAVVAAVEEVDA